MIEATVRTDDAAVEVDLDATPWFETADARELIDLAACGYGGDYPADAVALHFLGSDPGVTRLLEYAQENNVGFECFVDKVAARDWILSNRMREADHPAGKVA